MGGERERRQRWPPGSCPDTGQVAGPHIIQGGGCRGSGRKGMREVLSMWRVRVLWESRWSGLASSNLWGWASGDISHSGTVRGKREEGLE